MNKIKELEKYYDKECICVSDYTFNKTDSFPGVIFISGDINKVNMLHSEKYNLIGIYHVKQDTYVGMSNETFEKHFKLIKEK